MAEEQPSRKKQRKNEDRVEVDTTVRAVKFNLSKYPDWVRMLNTDEEFIKIFNIGVAVKESITMNITGGEKYFHEVLRQVKATQETLESKINELIDPLENCEREFMALASKPPSKGAVGEKVVLSILKEGLPQHTFEDVAKQARCGDIHVTSPVSEQKYLLEVKKHKTTVPAAGIQKFEENLRENKDFKVGILLSLDSGIARRAIHGKFEVTYEDEQYFIYVPNARKEENLIVWSVLLADELAALDQGLTESQVQEVQKLHKKFKENVEKSKRCRSRFNSLKALVDDLEEDLMPLLEIIDGAKNDLNKALHQRGKRSSKTKRKLVSSHQSTKLEDLHYFVNRDPVSVNSPINVDGDTESDT